LFGDGILGLQLPGRFPHASGPKPATGVRTITHQRFVWTNRSPGEGYRKAHACHPTRISATPSLNDGLPRSTIAVGRRFRFAEHHALGNDGTLAQGFQLSRFIDMFIGIKPPD
jgi:hypothetical protein